MARAIQGERFKNRKELEDGLVEAFKGIPEDFVLKLDASMEKRMQACILAKGGHTKH